MVPFLGHPVNKIKIVIFSKIILAVLDQTLRLKLYIVRISLSMTELV